MKNSRLKILTVAAVAALVGIGVLGILAAVSGSVGSHLRPGSVAATDETQYLHLLAWIDGSDYVHIRGNEVWYVHRNFQYPGLWKAAGCDQCPAEMGDCVYDPPRPTTINDVDWYPEWPDDCGYDDPGQRSLDTYTGLEPPQPLQEIEISLTKIQGRGTISIVEQPSSLNDYTTIVLMDDDADAYAAWYEFQLSYPTLEDCDDGIDNDIDGFVDCEDPDCYGDPACQEDCDDGIDNDGDTKVDCDDPDCAAECYEPEDCDDGVDNDMDGNVDCEDDDCVGDPACKEDCDDGIDNDIDGDVDCEDSDCVDDPACQEDCDDGTDNDGDGDVDCEDSDCQGDPACKEVCDDGEDNDKDGKVDCDDDECHGDPGCPTGKESWLKNPSFSACEYDPGMERGKENISSPEGCDWGLHGYSWRDKPEDPGMEVQDSGTIDESRFIFKDSSAYLYGKDDQNLEEKPEGFAVVRVIQGDVWAGGGPPWWVPTPWDITEDKQLYVDISLKKGESSSHLGWLEDFWDIRDRIMYAINVWLIEGDDCKEASAERMVLDLIFYLGSGDKAEDKYSDPKRDEEGTIVDGGIFHYQPRMVPQLSEVGKWEHYSFNLSKYIYEAIEAAPSHGISYDKDRMKLCQAEMLIELRHADAELTIGEFDLYYYPTSSEKMTITAFSPVDLSVADPEGLVINKQSSQIPNATYAEIDVNGDGDPDDMITILRRKRGEYSIAVVPEPDAEPTGTYTLEASAGDTATVLAENVLISEIPDQPYIIRSSDLVQGWNHTCYLGSEQPIDAALANIAADVQAVYRLGPGQTFEQWFPNKPEASTITTVSPYEPLFILMANDAAWSQTPSGTSPTSVDLVQGWNSVCYSGQDKDMKSATQGIVSELAVLYELGLGQTWGIYHPSRPSVSNIAQLDQYDAVLALVTEPGGSTWTFDL